ncbi:MAG TPA: peptide chain release factor N(5)-glutamine methyltransferase [Solirubrobacteraceae bacterium]|jgi:release factor glutamine methyltransferase|nr:peptide chain release factor N(5)-glutamine methyltransferase [Solirubrobacteraceae bacterium]
MPRAAEPLAAAVARLAAAGSESPRLDAELLLAEALGTTRAGLYVAAPAALEPGASERFEELVARRVQREPAAYILGRKPFRHIELEVDRRVLIPRPETELLVEVGLELPPGARVADIGTGSGAIALALAHERPDLALTGIDASADALVLARDNARRLGLDVTFVEGDLLVGGPYDAVLANLPYVREGEELPPEIARYEPAQALYGGPDGLDVIRRLVGQAAGAVALIALEVGAGQAEAVASLLGDAGFDDVERRRDLAGHERVVVGRR